MYDKREHFTFEMTKGLWDRNVNNFLKVKAFLFLLSDHEFVYCKFEIDKVTTSSGVPLVQLDMKAP